MNWCRYGLRVWLASFAENLWRPNDYWWPGQRSSVSNTAFVAVVIANACVGVRYSREWPSGRPERSA